MYGSWASTTRVGLGQVPGPGAVGTFRPWVTTAGGSYGCGCCGGTYRTTRIYGPGWGVGTGIIAIAILILIALGVIF